MPVIDARASRASQPQRSSRLADPAVGARSAAVILLLSLMAGSGSVGVAEAITRLAHAAGVEATLREGAAVRARFTRSVALLTRSHAAHAAATPAVAALLAGVSMRSDASIDRARLLLAAAGPLTHSDLPPPALRE